MKKLKKLSKNMIVKSSDCYGNKSRTEFYTSTVPLEASASDNRQGEQQAQVTLAFVSKIFRVDPKVLKEKIKQAEEKLLKGGDREKAMKSDPNYQILFDYLKTCE